MLKSFNSASWRTVRDLSHKKIYIGQTNNLELRVAKHNDQKVKSTKDRGIWKLIYKETFKTRSEAMKNEKYLKSGPGRDYLKKLLDK